MKKLYTLIAATLLCSASLLAERVQIGDLYYNLDTDNRTAEVTWSSRNINIPNYSGMTTVVIPDSVLYEDNYYVVTAIGEDAFSYCHSLQSVAIPDSVKVIKDFAFYDCPSLFELSIPDNVQSIASTAFADIPNIIYSGSAMGAPWSAKYVNGYAEGDLVYSDSGKTLVVACSLAASQITIPDCVQSIREYAFNRCNALQSVIIGSGVETIGESAFHGCGARSIVIPDNVRSIGGDAFGDCDSLQSIVIPDNVQSIGANAFHGCEALQSVSIGSGVKNIEGGTFQNCTALQSVVIPENVRNISRSAFEGCEALQSITIGSGVRNIENNAFYGCNLLTTVINRATNPQNIESNVFEEVDLGACTLYVPEESLNRYQNTEVWKDFSNISITTSMATP